MNSTSLSLDEAITVAQSRPLWRLMSAFGATHPQWCMPHKKKKKKKWNTTVYTAICGSVLHCVSKKCTNLVRNFKDLFIFGVRFERRKVDKKQTYMKTETCKLYYTSFVISAMSSNRSI